MGQGKSCYGDIRRTVWPTAFIFGTGGPVGKLSKSINFEWPWPNCSRSNLLWLISGEPFELQPSYLAQGDRLASPTSPLIWSDLELIVQGQSIVGDILRTVWPTDFMFGRRRHAGEPFKSINLEWPWPNCSRSIYCRWYIENWLTYNLHIWYMGTSWQALQVH